MGSLDLDTAKEILDAFWFTSGVSCRLISERGETLYQNGSVLDPCAFLRAMPGQPPACGDLHVQSIAQSERFGGRYIYTCPSGLTYFTSPIFSGGVLTAAFVAGPVLICDLDDCLDELIAKRGIPEGGSRSVRNFLRAIPQMEPSRLKYLSAQLYANAAFVGDTSRALMQRQYENSRQQSISEYVQHLKTKPGAAPYPFDVEDQLLRAISEGDKTTAAALLNQLLGYIYFFTDQPDSVQTRVTELLVLICRAAIRGGASCKVIFSVSHQYMQQLRGIRTQEEMTNYLAKILNRLTELVFDLVDSKHKNMIRSAVSYMTLNCGRDISLRETAAQVGYSCSHFSKIFKEETGCGFRAYLNRIRMEKAKGMLLSQDVTMVQVCEDCGFTDQSYFCKVFKKMTGVTPDKFRKQGRRISDSREHGED